MQTRPSSPVRIGIVDAHPAVVVGLSVVVNLEPDMQVAASAASADELLAQEVDLDVVVWGSSGDSARAARQLHAFGVRGVAVLAYSPAVVDSRGSSDSKGVVGVVSKADALDAIVRAIREIAAGRPSDPVSMRQPVRHADLTDREAEILALYVSGHTASAVASKLFISRHTVVDHIRNIRAKYAALDRGARYKTDLYLLAVEDGIVPRDARSPQVSGGIADSVAS
ncbi:response regulator transcription factor [Homoserinibacter sp. GY 40078]|uniref:response regulator transcription factor n=1 Tax=Homoserinibacter sp. GY 40078 TaxID=2603275 RepID=UPI0011C9E9C2|nr:LuxR C-terminal-related transcriptional regulator [Homoserinibacter sp. GY 40078]TXK19164.1 response regulator transcription factor [Homoserinibacter sp. GY 40078]